MRVCDLRSTSLVLLAAVYVHAEGKAGSPNASNEPWALRYVVAIVIFMLIACGAWGTVVAAGLYDGHCCRVSARSANTCLCLQLGLFGFFAYRASDACLVASRCSTYHVVLLAWFTLNSCFIVRGLKQKGEFCCCPARPLAGRDAEAGDGVPVEVAVELTDAAAQQTSGGDIQIAVSLPSAAAASTSPVSTPTATATLTSPSANIPVAVAIRGDATSPASV